MRRTTALTLVLLALSLVLAPGCSSPPAAACTGADCGVADGGMDAGPRPDGGTTDAGPLPDGASPDAPVTDLCPTSTITFALASAAHDTIAAGGTDAPLSEDGCVHLRISRAGDEVTDELVYGTAVVQRFVGTPAAMHGEADRDRDGVFEWTIDVAYLPADAQMAVIEDHDAAGNVLRRATYTMNGSDVHQLVEVDDGSGTLVTDEEGDVPASQEDAIMGPAAGTGAGACTAEQAAQIRMDMQGAISSGADCAARMGMNDVRDLLARTVAAQGIQIQCGSRPGSCAEVDFWSVLVNRAGVGGPIVITVDPTTYFDPAACGNRQEILLHELLHVLYGSHSGYDDPSQPESRVHDRVYACAALCEQAMPTRCQCASCLRTNVCDPRCAGFADCNPDLGAQCRCFARPRWYPTYAQCTVGCPSGIACFAATCRSVSLACP